MKYGLTSLAAAALLMAGCSETTTPTSAGLEQAVFTALGGLEVGEVLRLTGADAADLMVGGQELERGFVFIPFNASRAAGRINVEVSGDGLGQTDPSGPGVASSRGAGATAPWLPNSSMHTVLNDRFRSVAEPRLDSFQRQRPVYRSVRREAAADLSGGNAEVGELVEINTSVAAGSFNEICESFDNRTGRVEAITDRAIIVGDVDNPAGGFTRADYESFGDEFDSLVDPTITSTFGEPSDIDGNDRVIIFFTRAVNELTTPGSQGFVGGFFYSRDLFLKEGAEACRASNAGEIFYILAPDPNAQASHVPHSRAAVFTAALGTIGHEYQHLINASRRIWIHGFSSFETTWLDEGLSHIGEELLFYADANVDPRSNIGASNLDSQTIVDAINRFGVSNLVRYGLYLENVTREAPTQPDDDLETRGAAWSFLRYLADQRAEDDAAFFFALVNTERTGFDNLAAVLDDEPLDWFQRWGVSVYTDDLVGGEAVSLLQQPSWDFRSLLPLLGIFEEPFPLRVRTLNPGQTVGFQVAATSSGYVRFTGGAGEVVRLSTTSGSVAPPSQLRVTVVRIE
ncbi:MAG: hypothetical protein WD737_06015 [Gemmatimonadota bacterium]